jgi:rod shape-determining protein MreC
MALDHRWSHLETIRSALSTVVYPLQYAVDLPASIGNWSAESLNSRTALVQENEGLKRQNLMLRARLQKFEALQSENARLRDLLQSSGRVGVRVLIGELLAVDMDPFKRLITLNRGSNDGVSEGQPLLDADGVMGQVIHVSPLTSTAMLLTDPSHAIPVQVNRNGLRAIALGNGSPDQLEVPNLPNNADIREGDLLVSSGLGGRFPPGYPVARVTSVREDPSRPFAEVIATPTAHLQRSREVLLVWRDNQREETGS